MANSKITDYTALTGTGVDTAADLLEIVDASVTTNKKITIDELRIALLSNTTVVNVLGGDVALNNISNYFTGPTCAQGTSGTWFASGSVTLLDSSIASNFIVKLWDGATIIASTEVYSALAGQLVQAHLSGVLTSPAGNIRISVQDVTSTNGKILFNQGNLKDSILTVFRIG